MQRTYIQDRILDRPIRGESFIWVNTIPRTIWARGLGVMTSP